MWPRPRQRIGRFSRERPRMLPCDQSNSSRGCGERSFEEFGRSRLIAMYSVNRSGDEPPTPFRRYHRTRGRSFESAFPGLDCQRMDADAPPHRDDMILIRDHKRDTKARPRVKGKVGLSRIYDRCKHPVASRTSKYSKKPALTPPPQIGPLASCRPNTDSQQGLETTPESDACRYFQCLAFSRVAA